MALSLVLLAVPAQRTDITALAQSAGSGTFSGPWTTHMSKDGLTGTGSGTITFHVNADAGTFTCTYSGTLKASGSMDSPQGRVRVSGTGWAKHSSCSGSYNAASGRLSGAGTGSSGGTFTMTITTTDEDGEPQEQSQSQTDSAVDSITIAGTIRDSGGSGTITDEDGEVISWQVSGSFSGASGDQPGDDDMPAEDPCKIDALSDECFEYLDMISGGSELDDLEFDDEDGQDPCDFDQDSEECADYMAELEASLDFDFGPCQDDMESDACWDFLDAMDEMDGIFDDEELLALFLGEEEDPATDKQAEKIGKIVAKDAFDKKVDNPTKEDVQKTSLSEKLKYVSDPKVKSAIAKEFIKYKFENNEKDIEKLTEKLDEIKDKHEFMAELDKKANKLRADLGDKMDEALAKSIDAYVKGTLKWAQDASPRAIKESLWRLEDTVFDNLTAEDAYKAGKTIGDFKQKAEDIYKTAQEIQKINERVQKGRITESQAKVLRGTAVLSVSLKYAAKGIPIFGDHMSEIIDGTMAVTLKLAGKKAERTAALDKCFEGSALDEECIKAIEDGRITAY